MSRQWLAVVVVALSLAVSVIGCSAKKPADSDLEGAGTIDEEGLASGGSLAQYQRGDTGAPDGSSPLRDIVFGFDSDELDQLARDTLRENGAWLKDNPGTKVEIEGHCDERGTIEYNLALGAKRARSARDYLVTLGVSSDRLNTISYGEELPLCSEHTEACWQRNRRVHFVVLGK
jgi:peptidoglycan-associated lipoprotein